MGLLNWVDLHFLSERRFLLKFYLFGLLLINLWQLIKTTDNSLRYLSSYWSLSLLSFIASSSEPKSIMMLKLTPTTIPCTKMSMS